MVERVRRYRGPHWERAGRDGLPRGDTGEPVEPVEPVGRLAQGGGGFNGRWLLLVVTPQGLVTETGNTAGLDRDYTGYDSLDRVIHVARVMRFGPPALPVSEGLQ
jgi:hypothetical protein